MSYLLTNQDGKSEVLMIDKRWAYSQTNLTKLVII